MVETDRHSMLKKGNFKIIRNTNCNYLVRDLLRCEKCSSTRNTLRAIRSRKVFLQNPTSSDSNINHRFLSKDELIKRLQNAQSQRRETLKKVLSLSMKINIIFDKESIKVSNDQRELLCNVITSDSNSFEENSPMWLLWQQQKEQVSKSSKAMRWHPLIIRWCLSIYQTLPAAYKNIASKQNKFIALPHINTLKHISFTDPMSGFNPDILEQIPEDINFDSLKEHEKNVSIVFDEMKIQGNLVYKKSTGKVIGYTKVGDLNEEISEFSVRCCSPEADTLNISKRIATYVMCSW